MRKWLVFPVMVALAAALLLQLVLHRAPERAAPGVRVYIGSVIKPALFVAVEVDGKRVYFGPANSITDWGASYLRSTLTTWRTQYISYEPSSYPKGSQMVVKHSAGTSTSSLTRTYSWNDTHIWVIYTGTFSTTTAITLGWVAVQYMDSNNAWRTVTNDTLTVSVPADASYTIQLWLVWQDNGMLTTNWPKVFSTHIPYQLPAVESIVHVQGGTGGYGCNTDPKYSWQPSSYTLERTVRMYLACGTGTAPQSRTSYALANKVERYPVAVSQTGTGISVAATVSRDCTELGLEMDYYDLSASTTRTVLLLRWVTNVSANTPVTFYILPPPGG